MESQHRQRPWGTQEALEMAPGCQVKAMDLGPG